MCDKRLASPYLGKTILLQNEIVAKQDFGTMILWQSNTLANWYFGKMIAWDTRWPLSKQTHCSKQTILHIGSRINCKLNARKTTNPKVFDLHRKYSSKNIMKQMDPREPELSDCFSKSVWGLLPYYTVYMHSNDNDQWFWCREQREWWLSSTHGLP